MDDERKNTILVAELRKEIMVLFEELIKRDERGERTIDTLRDIFDKLSAPENERYSIELIMFFQGCVNIPVGKIAKKRGVLDTYKQGLIREMQMIDITSSK